MIAALWVLVALPPVQAGRFQEAPVECAEAPEVFVETEDGASVHLHRHPAEGPPVLLVHGVSSNSNFMDLGPDRSLAWQLQAAGFDAWSLDLRGHAEARRTGEGARQLKGWTLEDYGRYDLDAAIEHIREQTGAAQLGYVGHSMGGMVVAYYQAIHGDDALGAVVMVGSPVDFDGGDPLLGLARVGMGAGRMLPSLPSPTVARATGALPPTPLEDMLWSPGSVDREARRRVLARVAGPMSRQELAHLQRIVDAGHLVGGADEVDYTARLTELEAPLLVIAGRGDRIASPDRVRPAYELAGSPDKSWVIVAVANGFSFDAGHVDLLLGDAAPTEVHPLIVAWLAERLVVPPAP